METTWERGTHLATCNYRTMRHSIATQFFFAFLPPCAAQIAFHFIQPIIPSSTFDSKFVLLRVFASSLHRWCSILAHSTHKYKHTLSLPYDGAKFNAKVFEKKFESHLNGSRCFRSCLFWCNVNLTFEKLSHICAKKKRRACCVRCNKSTFRTKNKMKWNPDW